jgi:predicted NAD/FAD-binding protein
MPGHAVERMPWGARVHSAAGVEAFDEVILACHSDQALALLADADPVEREVLGAIRYQSNEAVLHTDASLLPRNRKAWAAWNAHVRDPRALHGQLLHEPAAGLPGDTPLVVTLNRSEAIDPARCCAPALRAPGARPRRSRAQRWAELQGHRHTWFAGAYWGWGFHEDGIRSARRVVDALQACAPHPYRPRTRWRHERQRALLRAGDASPASSAPACVPLPDRAAAARPG